MRVWKQQPSQAKFKKFSALKIRKRVTIHPGVLKELVHDIAGLTKRIFNTSIKLDMDNSNMQCLYLRKRVICTTTMPLHKKFTLIACKNLKIIWKKSIIKDRNIDAK